MEFKDIIGYESLYEISEKAVIRNKKKGKVLKPSIDTSGYYQIHFSKNGKSKKIRVHRLVAEHFIANPLGKNQVNHIDGNKLNNTSSNLEWVTASENIRHAWKNGLCKMTDKNRETARLNAIKIHSKEVIDLHTGIVFDSVVKACQALNFSYSTAMKHLSGIRNKPRFMYI
jgi:phosphoserine aminotransferase